MHSVGTYLIFDGHSNTRFVVAAADLLCPLRLSAILRC